MKDKRQELIYFANWWVAQGFITCIIEKQVDKYLEYINSASIESRNVMSNEQQKRIFTHHKFKCDNCGGESFNTSDGTCVRCGL